MALEGGSKNDGVLDGIGSCVLPLLHYVFIIMFMLLW